MLKSSENQQTERTLETGDETILYSLNLIEIKFEDLRRVVKLLL